MANSRKNRARRFVEEREAEGPPAGRRPTAPRPPRAGERLGKYKILRKLGEGGFSYVFKALDTVQGIPVALKLAIGSLDSATIDSLRQEIRLAAKLDHPNILGISNADLIEGRLVLAYPLADATLADRLRHRISTKKAFDLFEQVLSGLAHAHARRTIHCDVKPDNIVLFHDGRACLTDFGIARLAIRTAVAGSGSGTVGYLAPEQAFGRPSFRSDVFSAGLVLYRTLSRELPEWPFEWPPPGLARVRARAPHAVVQFLRRSLEVYAARRYSDAGAQLDAFREALGSKSHAKAERRPSKRARTDRFGRRIRETYLGRFGRSLGLDSDCSRCGGPVSESMLHCPWCAEKRRVHVGPVSFPARCPRCGRGRKLDWPYCAWCYGAGFHDVSNRSFDDRRYVAKCSHRDCRGPLVPFSRYCPWCRRKVARTWKHAALDAKCRTCGSSVDGRVWKCCCWCGTANPSRR